MKATQGSQSPEEVDELPACKDNKSDLAYELLVGKPPFEDKIRTLTRQMYDRCNRKHLAENRRQIRFPKAKFSRTAEPVSRGMGTS